MYMFFWFFKQLFYILKRFTKHKLLLLFVFFVIAIFLFLKPTFAYTFDSNVDNNSYTVPDLVSLPEEYYNKLTQGYIIQKYTYQSSTNYRLIILNSSTAFFWHSSSDPRNKIYCNGQSYTFVVPVTATTWGNSPTTTTSSASRIAYTGAIQFGSIIYANESKSSIYFDYTPPVIHPSITTSASSIENWSFTDLSINANDLPYDDYYELQFTYPNNSTKITGEINQYKSIQNNKLVFNIPKSWISQNIVIRSGSVITFDLLQYHREGNAVTLEQYSMGGYTLSLTSQEQQEANEDSNKQLLSDISQNQQQTTQAVENLENTITDSNVSDDSIFLPTLEVNDPTQVGINNIFDLLYNAFTTGDAEDIVLPFPFTNKTITIPGNLTYNVLHNNGGDILIRIIRAYWWYIIASYIAYDVFSKLKKIQEGNIEDVQKENIKGDML